MTLKTPQDQTTKESSYLLTDLVPLEKLQKIQDAFASANTVASTITTLDGTPITRPSNHCDVCKMIRATEKGLNNCMKSAKKLGQETASRMKPLHKRCLSCGFSDGAAPIIVNGRHIANWLVGQYHVRDVDVQRIQQYAREIGANESIMVSAFQEMPKISTAHFEQILDFLWIIANEISNMGYLNLSQKIQTEELARVKLELENSQQQLEEKVEQRTAELLNVNKKLTSEIGQRDKLQKIHARLVAAIEHTSETIVITNTVPEIIYVNPAFEKISGYTREEALGKNPSVLNSGMHDSAFFKNMWKTIEKGEVWKGRLINRKKNGELYHEDGTISPVKDVHGKTISFVAIKRDITQELEMERQLLQMNKMEAVGTLAAGIAHELNTPIQYVTDNTRFIEEVFQDYEKLNQLYQKLKPILEKDEKFAKEVEEIIAFEEEIDLDYLHEETGKAIGGALEGLARMATVVMAMKEFSHPGGADKEPEDINRLIESTVTVSTNEWKSCAEVELDLDPSLPEVHIYSGQIKQAILNLVVNAAHAITEKHESGMGTIRIATQAFENQIKITIEDNGTGIEETIVEKIFEPFFTTKTVGKGTGQGLAMVHNTITDGHGGTITVSSIQGKGSTFTITLPL